MKGNITVIVYTRNEEKNIKDCIISAQLLTDKIIVVDMESNDKTTELARNLGGKIFSFPYSKYVEPGRGFGIEKAETDWILILDADERITKELAEEIGERLRLRGSYRRDVKRQTSTDTGIVTDSRVTYYKIPRKNIFGKIKWLKHGGWWPDYQIRLINKRYFIRWPKRIHSTPQIKGQFSYLKNPLIHYFHGDLTTMVDKTSVFEDAESDLLLKAKKTSGTATFFRKYFAELYRRLIRNLGFIDGPFGIIEAIYQAFSKTITYLFLYEKGRSL